MIDLNGKVALITGGSRGIGKAIAIKLASYKANIVINYTSNKEHALKVKEEIESYGVKSIVIKCDVSKSDEVNNMIEEVVKEFGQIDILVNNAGITRDGLLMRMKEEDFDSVIDINLKGVFNCTKSATKYMMKKRYGKIINISSVVGLIGNAGQANYCASKAGVIGLTKSSARELASRNINVNAIAPGFIDTDMTSVLNENLKETMLKNIPQNRFGSPEDVANLVLFLASDMSSYITGQIINVDGGMVMQ
ncbi:3-oxoacyl-[acyl-carrier-protein] reductase [Paraclostridium sordellii]|uniref:3-oxoacyl-[acyl-carrier-protein] reductase n=1 Tax=Paraclostridium sordellii TaxID=1505 RepID=A0A0A8WFB9_PARSO|nr:MULTISPECIES: 3-oxoacyl-[acyl-carrier-protein] reductase [Paeniclostridium]MDU5019966.1 3-oxoacyl-[acyl-carrier-protein] reductase [Clostridiales bacterium]AUN15389.1 beta-ketoacyl-ACP reductase [Paeniclostridium sordellii]EPZ57021.1 3-oxoacyl-[acyl-carrier-protein] reductase [[Clostridium] sordellii VPI 9048] [Paeniclostridium sordellii VPI 9048]MBW4861958.1 3-oxoacyl-[acyl-carrier-protein] reductase [Paeniclostridium sp.]MBW4873487.1 3-oxoacyl-[acyl-carrier-protein] reductase [Paeniclostr